jgi:hypothetical protein
VPKRVGSLLVSTCTCSGQGRIVSAPRSSLPCFLGSFDYQGRVRQTFCPDREEPNEAASGKSIHPNSGCQFLKSFRRPRGGGRWRTELQQGIAVVCRISVVSAKHTFPPLLMTTFPQSWCETCRFIIYVSLSMKKRRVLSRISLGTVRTSPRTYIAFIPAAVRQRCDHFEEVPSAARINSVVEDQSSH